MEFLFSPELIAAFLTLTLLEIVLGIDNIVFISILTNKLPKRHRNMGRILGLAIAMLLRVVLLLSISWMMSLSNELFSIAGHGFSGRDLIMLAGGLFLLFKGVHEIHNSLEVVGEHHQPGGTASLAMVIVQIALVDIVFSLDSVITAVGLVDQVSVMIAAIVIAILVMMLAAGPISQFVDNNPPVKMLALCFIVLIGCVLVFEGWGLHVPKGYIYFAMAFSFGVQMLNLLARRKRPTISLRKAQLGDLYYNLTTDSSQHES